MRFKISNSKVFCYRKRFSAQTSAAYNGDFFKSVSKTVENMLFDEESVFAKLLKSINILLVLRR